MDYAFGTPSYIYRVDEVVVLQGATVSLAYNPLHINGEDCCCGNTLFLEGPSSLQVRLDNAIDVHRR